MDSLIAHDEDNANTNSCYSEVTHAPPPPRLELELTRTSCLERKKAFDNGEWGDRRFGTMLVFQGLFNACVKYRNLDPENDNEKSAAENNILNRAALSWIWSALYGSNRIPEGWTRLSKEQVDNLAMGICDTIESRYNIHITFISDA